MKAFVVAALFIATTCSASYLGAVSTQYHTQDAHGQYSYGYADPNSQKHESRSANGVTHGGYSYVDGHGIVQSVKYVADPIHGFQVAGTNLPKGPAPALYAAAPVHYAAAPVHYAAAPVHYSSLAYAAPWDYGHSAVQIHNGVPVETPEVQHAKAAHFAAHAQAKANLHHLHKRSLWGNHAYAAPWAYNAAPVQIHNGVPVETPEVQHAKAEHFAAHARAAQQNHVASAHLGYAPVGPVETPEVQHAKAAHFAAHAAARSGHAYAPAHHSAAHYAVPVIHNGVPVDTAEVQHAKAAHFAAVAEAKGRASHAVSGPAYHGASGYHGSYHVPIIHNGVPVETPEVQHAKAAHFAAVSEAKSRSWDHGHNDNGHYDNGHYDNGHYDNGHYDNGHWDNGHWDNGHHAW